MPEKWAAYDVQLSQALPRDDPEQVSLVRGYAAILAYNVLQGWPQIWPDPRLSKVGRHMLRVQEIIDNAHVIECDL